MSRVKRWHEKDDDDAAAAGVCMFCTYVAIIQHITHISLEILT